jgi:hypothetical protein
MGAPGSTRWNNHIKKCTVEDCLFLDINKLSSDRIVLEGINTFGILIFRKAKSDQVVSSVGYEINTLNFSSLFIILFYTILNTGQKIDSVIHLDHIEQYFGGVRFFFKCPSCNKRVAKLYKPPCGIYYSCRKCHELIYRSSQEQHRFDGLYSRIARRFNADPVTVKKYMESSFLKNPLRK